MARKTKPSTSKSPPRKAASRRGPGARPAGGGKSAVRKRAGASGIKPEKRALQAASKLAILPRGKTAKQKSEPKPKSKPMSKPKSKPWTGAEIEEAFRRLHAANPEPRGELNYVNPFTLLVAVVLSAQATDAGVNKATPALFTAADTPEKMVALGEDKVREMIRTIGLFRTKAKNVIALSKQLIAEHASMVPPIREELEKLPGVGRKTANVVLNNAFGQETIAVDTHIFRVGNRTGIAPGRNPLEVEMALEKCVPPAYRRHAHHWLILHGRYICKAQRPRCGICPINDLCRWPEKAAYMGE
jgi:endonuclease-3